MNPAQMNKNEVDKAFVAAINHIKDVTARNITVAVSQNMVKIDRAVLPALINLVNQSIDQGNSEANRELSKTIEKMSKLPDKPTTKKK